eukprot:Pgem_evm1s9958
MIRSFQSCFSLAKFTQQQCRSNVFQLTKYNNFSSSNSLQNESDGGDKISATADSKELPISRDPNADRNIKKVQKADVPNQHHGFVQKMLRSPTKEALRALTKEPKTPKSIVGQVIGTKNEKTAKVAVESWKPHKIYKR